MDRLSMEWGFRAHEKGMNLEMAMIEFDKLTPTPSEATEPLWRSDRYTDEDQNILASLKMDEIRDCVKELAHEQLDNMSQAELDGYLVNTDLLLPYHKLLNPPDGMTTEELLHDIAEEAEEDHADLLRFGLLVKDETLIGGYRITDAGIDVLQEWF